MNYESPNPEKAEPKCSKLRPRLPQNTCFERGSEIFLKLWTVSEKAFSSSNIPFPTEQDIRRECQASGVQMFNSAFTKNKPFFVVDILIQF